MDGEEKVSALAIGNRGSFLEGQEVVSRSRQHDLEARQIHQEGLQPQGDNTWAQTFASGDALRGAAGTANFGLVQAGALEQSNVDLTSQLVNMIIAQRNFQANAQMISTEDAITQTIINLR